MLNILQPLLILASLAILSVQAQDLPSVQKKSKVLKNLKIDGKTDDWGKFEAYNGNTCTYYSLAHDDSLLYLVIKVSDRLMINKLISSGITFTTNRTGKKILKDDVAITFPTNNKRNLIGIDLKSYDKIKYERNAKLRIDSLVKANNDKLNISFKEIKLNGLPNLGSGISVYNTDGIKAVAKFDSTMSYVYELAIDLKLLNVDANASLDLFYNKKINIAQSG